MRHGSAEQSPQRDQNGNYGTFVLQFWQKLHHEQFPYLKKEANRIISMFSTRCMCEQSFSVMKQIKSAIRNRLLDTSFKTCSLRQQQTFFQIFLQMSASNFTHRID